MVPCSSGASSVFRTKVSKYYIEDITTARLWDMHMSASDLVQMAGTSVLRIGLETLERVSACAV